MYCGQCGAKNDDKSTFCASCGAPLPGAAGGDGSTGGSGNHKWIGIAAAAVVTVAVAAVAVLLLRTFVFRTPAGIAKSYVKAVFNMDAQKAFDLLPDAVLDAIEEEKGYDIDTIIEEEEEELEESVTRRFKYIDELKLKECKVTNVSDVKGTDKADIKELYEEKYDLDVKAVKKIKLKVTYEYEDEEEKETVEIIAVKIGWKWYLYAASGDPFD